jgi:hypothetical protein
MSQNWLQIDAVHQHAQNVERADFLMAYPNPVLVAGEVKDGRLIRRTDKGTYGTHQYLSISAIKGPKKVSTSPVRFMPLRHQKIDDEQSVDTWMQVGRTADSEIMINDYTISKMHARVRHAMGRGGYLMEELGSTNGTWVNGERLVKNAPMQIQSSDTIRFGRHIFTFYLARDFYTFLTEVLD